MGAERVYTGLTQALLPAVLEAARLELKYFTGGFAIEKKPDSSPVTIADREAEAIIVKALGDIAPDIPVVAEEAASEGRLPEHGNRFFLVDALDGTRMFIRGTPEFSINIALVENGRPVFGLIYVPPASDLFVTRSRGEALRATIKADASLPSPVLDYRQLSAREAPAENRTAFNSNSARSNVSAYLAALDIKTARPVGSSLKFGLIAAGEGDVYARFGETYEWDTAAGQAILEAAGGSVLALDGTPLTYGKRARGYCNPEFIASGRTKFPLPAPKSGA